MSTIEKNPGDPLQPVYHNGETGENLLRATVMARTSVHQRAQERESVSDLGMPRKQF